MSVGNVGGGDASIRGIETSQAAGAGQPSKVKDKAIDQQTNHLGIHSFQSMNTEIHDIKEQRDVNLRGGSSTPEALCRRLKDVTLQFIASAGIFSVREAVRTATTPASAPQTPSSRMEDKLSARELPGTLSVIAGGVEGGKVDAQDAARILKFGQHQLKQYQSWEGSVKSFLADNEARLQKATSQEEKAFVEGNIRDAKDALQNIGRQVEALGNEVANLEKSIVSKYGSEGLNVSMPVLPANTSIVYSLRRIN